MLARGKGFAHLAAMHLNPVKAVAPDFRHVEAWIFDLDNTLYRADSDLFAQIDARMSLFMSRLLDVPLDEARRIQKDYYRDHGTTLNGLMKVNGIDPEVFLAFRRMTSTFRCWRPIRRSPRPSNGCRESASSSPMAAAIMRSACWSVSVSAHFDEVWDIRAMASRRSPIRPPTARCWPAQRVAPARAAMFEDVARNLVPAHALGMTTVWFKNGSEWSKQGPEFPLAEPASYRL